jgi:hypothetical protein
MGATKLDIITDAYSRGRVSGLTSNPTPDDLTLALRRLEGMMAQWEVDNICVGYNFEDDPGLQSLHNVQRGYWASLETALMMRLLSDFGKQPTPTLVKDARGAHATLLSGTAVTNMVQYPNRQPVGSGNDLRRNRFRRFYRPTGAAPNDCEVTNPMYAGNIDNFTEHFDAWLDQGETLVSYTITTAKPTNLVISADALVTPDVNYTVEAKVGGTYSVVIVVTSSTGRVNTRVVYFEVTEAV